MGIIVLVLMQQGKGADAGAAFGSGASGTVFGARGSANFLSRATAILATVFFLNSITLAFLASGQTIKGGSIMDSSAHVDAKKPEVAPVAPSGDVPPAPGENAAGKPQEGDVPLVPPSGGVGVSGKPDAPVQEVSQPEPKVPAEEANTTGVGVGAGQAQGGEKTVQEKQ
ncbi:preprotein translocase subunit SecG [Candidatus Thiothrix phosphatis]|uniref:preprotein translocase subunit SecG n=1 Tax=Candidatus Thiothrix phosphatis TaxID=3112415 RepID=UPI00405590E9